MRVVAEILSGDNEELFSELGLGGHQRRVQPWLQHL